MTENTEPILSAEGLVKSYGRRRVVDGVVLDVMPGEIVGLLGPNGAGKTTTFRMICGQVQPDRGRVFLGSSEVTRWPMYLRSRKGGMGYLPQKSSVFAKLSCEKNLRGMMQLLGFSRRQQKERTNELLERFDITHIRKSKAGNLSGGERRRLEIARCLVADPKIIMLDEPFAGIDPVTVQSIQVVIRELADDGIAILITDHAAREILQIGKTGPAGEGFGFSNPARTAPRELQLFKTDPDRDVLSTLVPTHGPRAGPRKPQDNRCCCWYFCT